MKTTAATILLALSNASNNATKSTLAAKAQAPQTNYIQRCSYFHVMKGQHTWPGADDVCNSGTQNVCILDPDLIVGECQFGSNFLGMYTSTQILTNETHFWEVVYNSYPTRSSTNHCQAGTEMKKQDIPSKMFPLKQGQFDYCMPQYYCYPQKSNCPLNPDWSEPSNFCSNHGGKYYKISAAQKCVGYATFTSTGTMDCKKANSHETSIEMICGGDAFGNPPCGCFGGTKYFYSRL